jgi:hypothetical protein
MSWRIAILQGRDLADIATVVLGNNRNLMLAPGGLLEHLPAGEPSYCLGPGPLYLPLGHRTRPELPPSARHALFGQDERHAVVLLPDHAYVFYLTTRRPAWSLWIGELPELDVHLPAATIQALRDLSLPDTTQELRPADTSQQQRASDSISNIWARLRSLRRPGEPWRMPRYARSWPAIFRKPPQSTGRTAACSALRTCSSARRERLRSSAEAATATTPYRTGVFLRD